MGAFIDFLKNNPNNLSYWFPKVKDCGIAVPKTVIIPVPEHILKNFFMEEDGDRERIRAFVQDEVMPVVEAMPGLPFIKNGCFSGKFSFGNSCGPKSKDIDTILKSILTIQYDSLCLDTGGNLEIVIRERIPSEGLPTIYGGMPLNTEIRIFYDFDRNRVLYAANYWDWDYCHEGICRHIQDAESYKNNYPTLLEKYRLAEPQAIRAVEDAFKDNHSLTGIWSVDLLKDTEGRLWLIDMALGHMSVYFDPEKIKQAINR